MSQQPSSIVNGPSDYKNGGSLETSKPTNGNENIQQPATIPPRPPLNRLDSRGSFPVRPGFPGPVPNRPLVQGLPQQQQQQPYLPQHQLPHPNQQRQPTPTPQQYIQRPPNLGQPARPQTYLQAGQHPQSAYFQQQQQNQPRNNFRPLTPYPRPPNQRPPGVFQQRSVPSFGLQRPILPEDEQGLRRSQTLDNTDLNAPNTPNLYRSEEYKPNMTTMQGRSYSLSGNVNASEVDLEERRRSVSSVDSLGEYKQTVPGSGSGSRSGSTENLDRKDEGSRPESRTAVHMTKIIEDDGDKHINPSLEKSFSNESTKSLQDLPKKEEKKEDDKASHHMNLNIDKAKVKPKDGDNDSGVDESTQGNDQSNGETTRAPRPKSSSKSRTSSTTPTKARSLSRGSKSPASLLSPDSTATTPGSAEKKKIPMNKIQVGSAPSPNLKVVRSKIGSLENAHHKPGGGNVKIENRKLEFKATPRIEAKNDKYTPKGGEKKIVQQKLQWQAKSKIGSLENATYKPKGGDKKIESIKLDFKEKAKPKVGSTANIKHVPGGGDVKSEDSFEDDSIENRKIDLKVQSKVGSLDNVKHKPGGGDKKIFDDKEYLKQMAAVSSDMNSLSGSQHQDYSYSARDRSYVQDVKEEILNCERLSRSGSLRKKRPLSATPRPAWRY